MSNKVKKYNILINEDSGTVSQLGKDVVQNIIEDSALAVERIDILKPSEFFKKIKELEDMSAPILIGGGDGTIKGCADILSGNGCSFGILPLGTMNLLASDLNIPQDLKNALDAYACGCEVHDIDVGMVNGHSFLCCVGIGTMPEGSEFREDNREQNSLILMPRLTVFILDQMSEVKHRIINMTIDGKKKRLKTAALVVSNNQYCPDKRLGENNFVRASLQDGVLGVYAVTPHSIWDKLRLILRLQFGNWSRDPVVQEWSGETMSLDTRHAQELVSLDGETQDMDMPLNFWIRRKALSILIPIRA